MKRVPSEEPDASGGARHSPFLRRWRLLREISRREEGRVVLAEDGHANRRRAVLKVSRIPTQADLELARHEFDVLRKLHHPHIAEVYDFGLLESDDVKAMTRLVPGGGFALPRRDGDRFPLFAYLALVHFDGLNLREAFLRLFPDASPSRWTEGSGEISERWRAFFDAVARICAALDYVHSRGLVHYDIKPENILLAPRGPGSSRPAFDVKLIDFGLCEQETTPVGTRVRGSTPYIAPEFFSRARVDRRSDLFSLGVTLATAVAGRPPFAGSTPQEWLEAARKGDTLELKALWPPTPRKFSDLVSRLLSPDPEARPASASALGSEIESLAGTAPTSHLRPSGPIVPTVGWERELKLIQAELEQFHQSQTSVSLALIEGGSGQFFTRLEEEVEALARTQGIEFVAVSCSNPRRYSYHPFTEALQKIATRLDLSQRRWDAFHPVLRLLAPETIGAPCDETGEGRWREVLVGPRFVDRLTEFFLAVGRELPVTIFLRDIHHVDQESLEVLRSIARNLLLERQESAEGFYPQLNPSRLFLFATFVAGTEGESEGGTYEEHRRIHQLSGEAYCLRLRLRYLPLDRLAEWIASRAPDLPFSTRSLEKLHEKTGGSPRLIDEFIRRCSEKSHGVDERETGNLEQGFVSTAVEAVEATPADILFSLPQSLGDALLERLELLPADGQALLNALAAAGSSPLPLDDVALLARRIEEGEEDTASGDVQYGDAGRSRQGGAPPVATLTLLQNEGFVELRSGVRGPEVVWSVEAARQLTSERLEARSRRHYHRLLYGVLSSQTPLRGSAYTPEDLAYHTRHAELREPFLREALKAAERFRATHAIISATTLYEQILEHISLAHDEVQVGDTDADSLRWQLNAKLADLYSEGGFYSRAIENLTVLLSLKENDTGTAELGTIYRRMGELYLKAGDHRNAAHFLEKSVQVLSKACSLGQAAPTGEGKQFEELCRALIASGRYHLQKGELEEAKKQLDRCLEALNSSGDHAGLRSTSYRLLALVLSGKSDHARSLTLSLQALKAAGKSADRAILSEAIAAVGGAYLATGEYDKAIEYFRRGARLAEKSTNKLELARCYSQIGTIYHNRGDHSRALEYIHGSLRLSQQLNDLKGVAQSYNNLGIVYRLRDDTQKAAESYKKAIDIFSRLNDQSGMAAGMTNLSGVLEQEGKYNEALEYSLRALEKRKRYGTKSGTAFSHYRIGRIYQSKGELDKAVSYAEKSLQLRKELGEKMGIAYSRLQLAEIYLSQARLFEAFQHCQGGLRGFETLENQIGELWGKEILARILCRVGNLEEARSLLEQVVSSAREQEQQAIVGNCLLQLGALALDSGDFHEAERHLQEAEKLFRRLKNQRQLAEALLQVSVLKLELGHFERAEEHLEEAYSLIEELGIRDLTPVYFLHRGRLEAESPGSDLEKARKHLQRGLMEAREGRLADLHWRLHFQIGVLERQRGDPHLARIHLHESKEILEEIKAHLPVNFQENFFCSRERADLLKCCSESRRHWDMPAAQPKQPPQKATQPRKDPTADAQMQQRLMKLHEVAAAIGTERNLGYLLEKIMDAVLDLGTAERGFLILTGGRPGERTISVARNLDKEQILDPERKISNSVASEVLRTGKPVLSGNALLEDRFTASKSVHDLRLCSLLCVPLKFRDEMLGVIYLDNRHRQNAFNDTDLKVLQTFSDQAAVAITNARLFREKEDLNLKLHQKVHRQSVQLVIAREDLRNAQTQLEGRYNFENIVGRSKQMREVFFLLEKLSRTQLPVLIHGESGTGKELIARAIHFNSSRRQARFVSENCGALTESLLETELFGHKRGAFTGAIAEKKGLFELAHGGTLFLDEIGDMSLGMQQRLLRVLEEGELRPVGSKDIVRVDVRIISASNKDLQKLVAEGGFREDLFYRLNGVRIGLPPLRERREDVQHLIKHFLREIAAQEGRPVPSFSPDAIRAMEEYSWPGNVRELRHFVEKTVLLASGNKIGVSQLNFDGDGSTALARLPENATPAPEVPEVRADIGFRESRDLFERQYVVCALELSGWNVAQAAQRSGISRESFYRLLRKHGIQRHGSLE